MQKKIDFEILEKATQQQKMITNWLLLKCADLTVTTAKVGREKRQKKFDELKKSIMPDFNGEADSLNSVVKEWWQEEVEWQSEYKSKIQGSFDKFLLYRLQRIFFKNHGSNPFKDTVRRLVFSKKVVMSEDFYQINQNLFGDFLKNSIEIISHDKEFESLISIIGGLKILQKVNISECVASTTHKIFGKDWKMAQGFFVGGGIGVISSIFFGPVIGTAIGEMAGFSGAAATSYGLAFLGGGSLASGGLGMAGGSMVLGLGFGIVNGARGVNNVSQDDLDHAQAGAILPLLLSIGRIQYQELGDKEVSGLIHNAASQRLRELDQRLVELKKTSKSADKKKFKVVEETKSLYQNAVNMSNLYDWYSGHDIWKKAKKIGKLN